ncbi:glycosyltransferase family 4 protein [Georgenia yuyongxinii]|uniref:D-inositol 3-phosphate glycosyltransferase n=1 Tax=Georgenia yuyongxinii TaxID=2589797 RepID=A0A552WWD1_9MICO|nr:glycosyltransferase family 4 protein [Georgenia yuyongxinii]TRW47092.1 glycosyltransferase family 4 protein [Georgenia yuyongxinii]
MRVGIVCPYSFDAPGGVQFHVRDLAEELIRRGHTVSVLAPAEDTTPVPDYVVSTGRTVAIPYNGSVARLNFGPVVAGRVRRWVEQGEFDLLHIHEPMIPSLSMLALWVADGPVVATFHTSMERSRGLQAISPVVIPMLEKIAGRIAVSEEARRTLVQHLGGDAVVVPNGVYVDRFADAPRNREWEGTDQRPTVAFLGRLDEPRKGLPILAAAVEPVLREIPGARFLIAGRGEAVQERELLAPFGDAVSFLGGISDAEKASLFASVDAYVAPQTGGESFGIVLVEAMSAGSLVIASDIPAFQAVLDGGTLGRLFHRGDPASLARVLTDVLGQRTAGTPMRERASTAVHRYDWSTVTSQVLAVYDMVLSTAHARVSEDPRSLTVFGRLRAATQAVTGGEGSGTWA